MAKPLTPDDFPLYAIGALVYRRSESSPLFQAPDDQIAADICFRLNAHEAGKCLLPAGFKDMVSCDPAPDAARGLPPIGRTYKL